MADKNKGNSIVFDRDLNPNTKEFKRKKKKPTNAGTKSSYETKSNVEDVNQSKVVTQEKESTQKSQKNNVSNNNISELNKTSKSKAPISSEQSERQRDNSQDGGKSTKKTVSKTKSVKENNDNLNNGNDDNVNSNKFGNINNNGDEFNNNLKTSGNNRKKKDTEGNDTISPTIINDLQESKPRVDMNGKITKRRQNYKISFIYKRQNYNLDLKGKSTVEDLQKQIAETLHLFQSDVEIMYKGKPLDSQNTGKQKVLDIIKDEKCPIFEIKKKSLYNNLSNVAQLYPKVYNDKVIVDGITNSLDLHQKIDQFFKDCCVEKDYYCEPLTESKYSVGFPYPDLAFDFNRYLLILKGTNEIYSNIKSSLQLNKGGRRNRHNLDQDGFKNYGSIFSPKKNSDKYSSLYVGLSGPYMSQETRERKEYLENKKKWICKQDFIPYVRKNPNWYNNKYMF